MTCRRPPGLALWLLENTPVQDELAGDLLEELASGRSVISFWIDVLAASWSAIWRTAPRYRRSSFSGALCGATAAWSLITAVSQLMLRLELIPHAVDWRGRHYVLLLLSGFLCTAAAGWIVARLHRTHRVAAVAGFAAFVMTAPSWQMPFLAILYPNMFSASIQPHLPFLVLSLVILAPLSILVGVRLEGREARVGTFARRNVAPIAALLLMLPGSLIAQSRTTAQPDLAALARRGAMRAEGRQVSYLEDGAYHGARVSAGGAFGVVWLDDVSFSIGTIEVDLRGRDVQGQSFLGLAFDGDGSAYETLYVRPFNFRTDDPARRIHAVQYESMPAYPWSRLRSEFPEVYENPVDPAPDPDGWVRLRLLIEPTQVQAFVGDGAEPDLTVPRLSLGGGGRLGLWVGTLSGGDFANLRLLPANP